MKSIVVFFLFISTVVFSQVYKNTDYLSNYNFSELEVLKRQIDSFEVARNIRVANYLQENRSPKVFYENGVKHELMDVIDNTPEYYVTHNLTSSQTIRAQHLYNDGSLGLNVQGQNMVVGIWDGGAVRNTHQEFTGKVFLMDSGSMDNHATHVTGTVVASGVNPQVRGISFNSSALSYDWQSDFSEMLTEASNGLLVSNHSYGPSSSATWTFGAYDLRSSQLDQLCFNAPFYTVVKSAGNDRNNFGNPEISAQLNAKFGYDLLKGWANAKNIILVGAVFQVTNYVNANSVVMSDFSSWGPTDDGRIKPDVVAKGVNVLSTTSSSNTSTGALGGTSMSAPAVSGGANLLQQHYFNTFNSYMRSSTLRGLINHTADEAGFAVGPDYEFGWGLMNVRRAAEIITAKQNQTAVIDEINLTNGSSYTTTFASTGNDPLMVSICWTDPASSNFNTGTVDPSTLYLVNDLDLRVSKDGETFYPWTLDPSQPFMPALREQDNFRDNFEKVQIDNPNGVYQLQVTHKGSLVGSQQRFSLIISGPNVTLNNQKYTLNSFSIYPNPATNSITIQLENELDGDFKIFDIQGRSVMDGAIFNGSATSNVETLSNGVYLIKVTQGTSTSTKRFIKR